jgi:hypothetical protein
MVPPSGLTADAGSAGGAPGEAERAVVENAGPAVGAAGVGAFGAVPNAGVFEPSDGGATPIIVPLSFGFGPAAAAGAAGAAACGATGAAGAGGGGAPGAGAPAPPGRGMLGGAFIMSMVPLNFGAAEAAFNAKPHFAHAVAVS